MKKLYTFTFPAVPRGKTLFYYKGQEYAELQDAVDFCEMALCKWDSDNADDGSGQIIGVEIWAVNAWGALNRIGLAEPQGERGVVWQWFDPIEDTELPREYIELWWNNERRLRG